MAEFMLYQLFLRYKCVFLHPQDPLIFKPLVCFQIQKGYENYLNGFIIKF